MTPGLGGNSLISCDCRYFHVDAGHEEPIQWQMGVVRTNCMDNLDRTNVAQAAVAKWTLERQLKAANVISAADSVDNHEDLVTHLREGVHRVY